MPVVNYVKNRILNSTDNNIPVHMKWHYLNLQLQLQIAIKTTTK